LLGVVIATAVLVAACGGGAGTARSASSVTDDVLRLFQPRPLGQVARGAVEPVPEVLARNQGLVDDAFRQTAFVQAVREAEGVATPAVQSKVEQWFGHLEDRLQRQAEARLHRMLCEARLYASNQTGDMQVIGDWVLQQFLEVGIDLQGVNSAVAEWLTEKVNDSTSTYTLACIAWARGAAG
jgi:hypothetical protein